MTLFSFSTKDSKAQDEQRKHVQQPTTVITSALACVPNVFVVPPEEDHTPTWCYYDAIGQKTYAPPSITTPDIQLDPALTFDADSQPPTFHRDSAGDDVVMPKRGVETRSVMDVLMDSEYVDHYDTEDESDRESEVEEPAPVPPRSLRDVAEDSDVIEVMKVKKKRFEDAIPAEISPPPPTNLKRSASFKSRASKAFRSLKGTLRSSKPRAQDVFIPPVPPIPSLPIEHIAQVDQSNTQRPRTPTLSRRPNMLSQLFNKPGSIRARDSVSSFQESISPTSPSESNFPTSPTESNFPASSASSMYSNHNGPFSSNLLSSRRSSMYRGSEEPPVRAPSPALSTFTTAPSRRFSRINLQRIFSFSSSSSAPSATSASIYSGRTTPTLSSSSPPSSSLESDPQTPISLEIETTPRRQVVREQRSSESIDMSPTLSRFGSGLDSTRPLSLSFGLGLGIMDEGSESIATQQPKNSLSDPDGIGGDVSFEMRLDSLHFESLSFDADRFN